MDCLQELKNYIFLLWSGFSKHYYYLSCPHHSLQAKGPATLQPINSFKADARISIHSELMSGSWICFGALNKL